MREAEFDEFYTSTSRRLIGQIYSMIGNLSEAEDAVAEAYARAWQRWSSIHDYADLEAWVRTVAYRVAVSSWRKSRNRLVAHRRNGQVDRIPPISPDQVALDAALRKIPMDQRRAIVLYHLVGLSVEEIARETGVPTGTVKTRLARGRKGMAAHVSEFVDDEVVAGPEVRHA